MTDFKKQCIICKDNKSIDEFYINKSCKDLLMPYCKKCHYKKNRQAVIKKNKLIKERWKNER